MAYTKLADVIQPERFAEYVIEKTTEKNELMFSGAVQNNPELNTLITGGGTVFTMPKWNDLGGESEVLNDTDPITINNITSKKELATLLIRAKAWGAHELAGALAGSDPMKAIAGLVSDWWVRDEKKNILAILDGIFNMNADPSLSSSNKVSDLSDLVLDITGSATTAISENAVLDAKQLMGDASDMLTMLYMNSATYTALQKKNVIQYIPVSESHIQIPTYLGYRVVMDDSCPFTPADAVAGTPAKYTTYLLSQGCIQRGTGTPATLTPVETDRLSDYSTDVLYNRQAKVLHPRGISWIGAGKIVNSTPTNNELANKSYLGTDGSTTLYRQNWERTSDIKKIGIVKLVHTL